LARAGANVLVLEQRTGYERRLGESLPASATQLLHELGLWDEFLAIEPVPVWLNASAWGGPELQFDDFMFKGAGPGWHIDRGKFETMLSTAAGRAGATILLGCSAVAVENDEHGYWLQFARQSTLEHVRGNFFIDAAGRARHAWQPHGGRRQFDHMIGIGLLARTPAAGVPSYTLIEAVPDGWFYSAQVGRNEIVVCYMTDGDLYARARIGSGDEFRARLAEAPHTSTRLTSANMLLGPWCAAAGTSLRHVAAGANWIVIGDAAMSCDPLSASGLITAIRSGLHAAAVVTQKAGLREQSLASWSDCLTSAFRSYLTMRRRYYALEQRFPDSLFWKRRQNTEDKAVPEIITGTNSMNSATQSTIREGNSEELAFPYA
jgi:flavin-dependent dehydrogenase